MRTYVVLLSLTLALTGAGIAPSAQLKSAFDCDDLEDPLTTGCLSDPMRGVCGHALDTYTVYGIIFKPGIPGVNNSDPASYGSSSGGIRPWRLNWHFPGTGAGLTVRVRTFENPDIVCDKTRDIVVTAKPIEPKLKEAHAAADGRHHLRITELKIEGPLVRVKGEAWPRKRMVLGTLLAKPPASGIIFGKTIDDGKEWDLAVLADPGKYKLRVETVDDLPVATVDLDGIEIRAR